MSSLDTILAALSDKTSQLSDGREIRLVSEGLPVREGELGDGAGASRSCILFSSFKEIVWSAAGTEEEIAKS